MNRFKRLSGIPFNALNVPGGVQKQICSENPRRIGLMLYNVGTGTVYLSEDNVPLSSATGGDGYPIRPGDSDALSSLPWAPQNAIYATADAGHDLRGYEIIGGEEQPSWWPGRRALLALITAGALLLAGLVADAGAQAKSSQPWFQSGTTVRPQGNVTQVLIPAGATCPAAGMAFLGEATTGVFHRAAGFFSICTNGTQSWEVATGQVGMAAGLVMGWHSGVLGSGLDLGLSRAGVGVLAVGNGTPGSTAGAIATTVVSVQKVSQSGFTFANIATTLTANGDMGFCSDCTIANPCAGAGTGALAKRLNAVNVCN